MIKYIPFSFLLMCAGISKTQNNYSIEIIHQNVNTSLRGLSVVNDSVIWVSGSNGYIGRSEDAGNTWKFQQIHPYDSAEFRDIEAIDNNTAIVMSSVQPACILKTSDGGKTWKEVFRNDDPKAFLDAFDFYQNKGICIGDPIQNWFYLLATSDGGETWTEIKNKPAINLDSTAAFAASGSIIQWLDEKNIVFVTGGKTAALFRSKNSGKKWKMYTTPMISGDASQGIFSMDFTNLNFGVIGGGDYLQPENNVQNFYFTDNVSKSQFVWNKAPANLSGYISCLKIVDSNVISCGTKGVDISDMLKKTTLNISKEGFNVIGTSQSGKVVYLAGNNGKIGKLYLN